MADTSPEKGNVIAAVIAWWEMHRPFEWSEEKHVAHPTVNCMQGVEHDLAKLAAQLVCRATPPSPSTAPEAWVYECRQPGDDKDKWCEFFSRERPSDEPYLRNIRPLYGSALTSRPAEVDDEGLPPMRTPEFCAGDLESGEPVYTAEQYRQGQRDAVAADRARREKGGE
jgi:hypothetical protein